MKEPLKSNFNTNSISKIHLQSNRSALRNDVEEEYDEAEQVESIVQRVAVEGCSQTARRREVTGKHVTLHEGQDEPGKLDILAFFLDCLTSKKVSFFLF